MSTAAEQSARASSRHAVKEQSTMKAPRGGAQKAEHVRRQSAGKRPSHVVCVGAAHSGTCGEYASTTAANIRLRLSRETSLKKSGAASTRWQRGQHNISKKLMSFFLFSRHRTITPMRRSSSTHRRRWTTSAVSEARARSGLLKTTR